MPWKDVSAMDERAEFVRLAGLEGANRRELCRRFGISPDVGYKWLGRFAAEGEAGLAERSRRPLSSPLRCGDEVELRICGVRAEHPAWGARKIKAYLEARGHRMPACSTVHQVLVRHGLIVQPEGGERAWRRFEAEAPNDLWQMDFKGWQRLGSGERLCPLTVIDDHSRFSPCLKALGNETREAVVAALEPVFRSHGLPQAIFTDNGKPWGDSQGSEWTGFGVWLLKLGVDLIHARPYHPQSRGKNERFHRSLDEEVLNLHLLKDHAAAQKAFDRWRHVYNYERPHGGIGHKVPASRYRPSPRAFPETLPEPYYDAGTETRKVSSTNACFSFKGRLWRVPEAFCGERLAIRPLETDGQFGVFFASHLVRLIDLTQ